MHTFLLLTLLCCLSSLKAEETSINKPTIENDTSETVFPSQRVGNTTIRKAWIRATNGKNAAVFMVLENAEGDRLLKAECDSAEATELHAHVKEGDIVRMRAVDALVIKDTVALKPGNLHIMLIDLHHPLKEGDKVPLRLMFENSGSLLIEVPVFLRSPYRS